MRSTAAEFLLSSTKGTAVALQPGVPHITPGILDRIEPGTFPPSQVATPINSGTPVMQPTLPAIENSAVVEPDGAATPGIVIPGTGVVGWVKENPITAVLIAAGVVMLISGKGKLSGKKKSLLPVVLVGGGLAAYLILNKKQAADNVQLPADGYTEPVNTNAPTVEEYHGAPASEVITDSDPLKMQYYYSITSLLPSGLSNPLADKLKLLNSRQLADLYSISGYIPPTETLYWNKLVLMTEPELQNVWAYVSGYLANGIPLLSQTRMLPNGQWDNSNPGNAALYSAMQAIKSKYGIF